MEPAHISRYEIHSPLGQGGMGTVYKARDPVMDRWVAIKTVTVKDAQQRARFQQEVRAAGKLNHPHITTIYDVGEEGELAYIVMELVEGETLASHLLAPVPWPKAIELLLPLCHALAYAHSQGVIHRDVKPANILISTAGQVKLTDFGVARLEAALRRITESGSTVGTPLYTAPEQLRNEAVDGRADLFSVGIVLFELITGQHPFLGETLAQVVYQITQPEPANLEPLDALASASVVVMVGRTLSKDPGARFANAEEMAVAMERYLAQPDATLPPPSTPVLSSRPATSRPIIEIVPSNLRLSPAEERLLRIAFAGHDQLYLEREFSSGYSQARVLLVTPVRSGGRRLAQVILKLDIPAAIDQEWRAYQKYVKDTLPPVTARILEEPLYGENETLALLRYTFAGGLGGASPESLRTYYIQHGGKEVAALLEKSVFRAFGTNWWLQRRTDSLILRREYDRLLPVQLGVTCQDLSETNLTMRTLVAGETGADTCRELEIDQLVQIQGFTLEEIGLPGDVATLRALPPSGTSTNPIRVRVTGLSDLLKQQVGETVPQLLGIVTATRRHLLYQLAESAWPDQDFNQKQIAIGGQLYPNPLFDYEALLDQRVSAMRSIIHGDLNLENILVTPTSGLAWLIDFATTRQGHNLYDFMRLETQVITKLLPQTQVSPEAVAQMMYVLHQPDASPQYVPSELQKPFAVLAAIRGMVRVCMHNRENWDEYYLGLAIMLLGALKFKELDATARTLTLAAAAAVRGLITIPALLHTPTPAPTPVSAPSNFFHPKVVIMGGISLVVLVILIGLAFWFLGVSAPPETPIPTLTPVRVVDVQPATPTNTSIPTPIPSSTAERPPTGTIPPASPPTATTSPTVTPNLTPECPAPTVYSTLADEYPSLGCSVGAWQSDFTYQDFERGLMIWRKSPDPAQIYVLAESGEWRQYDDPKGPPLPSCPEGQQNDGLGPIFGFGVIWCNEEMERLGLPLTGEMEYKDSPIEEFEDGLVFKLEQADYVLLQDGKWVSISPTPLPPDKLEPCQTNPAPEFQALWDTYQLALGCATDSFYSVDVIAEEAFEGGHLFRREDTGEVYVVYDRQKNGTMLLEGMWEKPPQKWDGQAVCDVGPAPPPSFLEPERGFGWLWCTHLGGPSGPLGWALGKEFPGNGQVQQFEQGFGFKGDSQKVYALLDNGRFLAHQLGPGPLPTDCSPTGWEPADVLKPLWEMLEGGNGPLCYPESSAFTDRNYARQLFERGFMFWWEASEKPQPIWVIYTPDSLAASGDTWNEYMDLWDGQEEYPPDCPEAGPPLGPRHGFGLIWCNQANVRDQVGRPLKEEFGSGNTFPRGAVQFFQGGIMFENPAERQVWALIYGDGWYRQGY